MKYDFDTPVDRSRNLSVKYDDRSHVFGRSDVIPLWVADMDFKTAQPVIDALEEKAREGIWGYTSRPISYFEAYRDWQMKRHNWSPDPHMMSWCPGVVPALAAIVELFTEVGDEVLIETPVYPEFYTVVESRGRKILDSPLVEKDGTWVIDFADFEKKARKAKMFLLCSPQNPLGIVWSREELERMARICFDADCLLISDEIHSDLIFHGKTHIPTASLSGEAAGKVITCISATKTFNLAGLQASATVFPDIEKKEKFEGFWRAIDISRNNAFSVVAMETALREGEEWLDQLLSYIDTNFRFIHDYCARYIPLIKPNVPDATYLVWLDCRGLSMSQEELVRFMAEEAGLGLNDGSRFQKGLEGFMRLNAACPRCTLEKALTQLRNAVAGRKSGK